MSFFVYLLKSISPGKKKTYVGYTNNLTKKYELNEIVTGDSIFCATGITSGDLVAGIKIHDNDFVSETLVTHKSSNLKKVIKTKQIIK